jgi:hypothetical protein
VPPDPDQLVLFASTRTEFEAGTIAETLRSTGIEARVFSAAAMGIQWEGGISNNVRIMVRARDLHAAQEALGTFRRHARSIDWSAVDVGEPEDELPSPRSRIAGLSPALYRVRIIGMALLTGVMLLSLGLHPLLSLGIAIALAAGGWQAIPQSDPETLTASQPAGRGSP